MNFIVRSGVVAALAAWSVVETIAKADSINAVGVAVLEDFNTLASSGTSSSMPKDWVFVESGGSANTTYTAGTGSSSTGDTYSFGAASSTERALGSVASASVQSTFGSKYTNNTGTAVGSLLISFDGEQWRSGGLTSGEQRLNFQYSLNATSLATGAWIDVDALDIRSLVNNSAAGALDGNTQKQSYSATIAGLDIGHGSSFWVRFVDPDDTGNDHGLAVDNFSITAFATPEPSTMVLGTVALGAWLCARRLRRRGSRLPKR